MSLTPEMTWVALLAVQTLHLLHHVAVKRHISVVEVLASATLLISPAAAREVGAAGPMMVVHIGFIAVQLIGSIGIRRLSPGCGNRPSVWASMG